MRKSENNTCVISVVKRSVLTLKKWCRKLVELTSLFNDRIWFLSLLRQSLWFLDWWDHTIEIYMSQHEHDKILNFSREWKWSNWKKVRIPGNMGVSVSLWGVSEGCHLTHFTLEILISLEIFIICTSIYKTDPFEIQDEALISSLFHTHENTRKAAYCCGDKQIVNASTRWNLSKCIGYCNPE